MLLRVLLVLLRRRKRIWSLNNKLKNKSKNKLKINVIDVKYAVSCSKTVMMLDDPQLQILRRL